LTLAEGWLGAAHGRDSFVAVVVSTTVEGGIVLNGQLLDGATGHAGHIGHVVVEPNGRRCTCGSRGCLEAEVSAPAIEAITGRSLSEPTYEMMQRTGRLVGRAVASVCNLLDVDFAVVGGAVALGFGATFFNSAQETLDELARLSFSRGARIIPVRLGDRGPLIGAGAVGLRGLHRATRAA
jgi:glucokinase